MGAPKKRKRCTVSPKWVVCVWCSLCSPFKPPRRAPSKSTNPCMTYYMGLPQNRQRFPPSPPRKKKAKIVVFLGGHSAPLTTPPFGCVLLKVPAFCWAGIRGTPTHSWVVPNFRDTKPDVTLRILSKDVPITPCDYTPGKLAE